MKDIYITWEDYHNKIEQLAKKVYDDNLKFNQIKTLSSYFIHRYATLLKCFTRMCDVCC